MRCALQVRFQDEVVRDVDVQLGVRVREDLVRMLGVVLAVESRSSH